MTKFEINCKTCSVKAKQCVTKDPVKEGPFQRVFLSHMPAEVRHSWTNHNCGFGVMTMQGFERRNRESKPCAKKFSNKKGNLTCGTLQKKRVSLFKYANIK